MGRSVVIAGLLAIVLVLAACGGGDDSNDDASTSEEPSAAAVAAAAAGAGDVAPAPTGEAEPEPPPEPAADPEPPAVPEPQPEPEPEPLTRAEYIIEADVICAELTSRTDALGEPETLEAIAAWSVGFMEIAEDGLPRLRALEPPADDRAGADAVIDLLAEQAAIVPELGAAAEAGDEEGVNDVIDRVAQIGTEADTAARAYGFRECGVDDETESVGGAGPDQDMGDLVLTYVPSENEALQGTIGAVAESEVLDVIVDAVNDTIALPRDIGIFVQGEIPGPAYYPEPNQIAMPPEFVDLVFTLFANSGFAETPEDVRDLTLATLAFVFVHELGHALTAELALPITGREEDAADQLATVLITSGGDQAGAIAIAAGSLFGLFSANREQFEAADFWDEHSLDEQRFFNILCWVYGSDPSAYADVILGSGIGEDRLVRCEAEWEQLSTSWESLLAPHIKQ